MKSKRAREAAEAEDKPIDAVAEAPAKKRKRDGDQEDDSTTLKKSKKDKKDKKDKKKEKKESRKEKKEKRKDLQNLPDEDGSEEQAEEETAIAPEPKTAVNGVDKDKEQKKKEKKEAKKEKKRQKSEDSTKNAPAPKEDADETNGDAAVANGEENPNVIDLDASAATKADRHIVFVGNLPFSATAATISAHFASLSPIAVRCLKNKDDDNPCRGIAFVEFGKVWHQRTCLDKFHHSMFSDGVSPPRKINVELTAGGGGKTKQRKDKIRAKNQKLDENRTKRIEREKVAKEEGKQQDGPSAMGGIHPSRLARVPGLGR